MSLKQAPKGKRSPRKALGRGLGALIPVRKEDSSGGANLVEVTRISPNPFQPRRAFDERLIEELSRSIAEHGIIQPIIVTRFGDAYQLVAGERRLRAARKLGLEKVPVVIRDEMKGDQTLSIALIENIQREDLNPIEEALAYEQLHDEFGLTQAEIARRVGRERSTVANSLRLLKLPMSIQSQVASGDLSMGHARPLLSISSTKDQEKLARRVLRDDLSVRQVEALVLAPDPKKKKQTKTKDVFTRDAEEKLTRALRTRVEIHRQKRGGTIRIAFSSEDELIRLFESIAGGRRRKK